MPILASIDTDLKVALKAKDAVVVSTLRMLKSALHNEEIALRKKALSDDETVKVIRREVKRRKDAIDAYVKGGRQDLADKEQGEHAILLRYLPAQIPLQEIEKATRQVIEELGAGAAFGQVMGGVMKKLQGKADGGTVSDVVRRALSSPPS